MQRITLLLALFLFSLSCEQQASSPSLAQSAAPVTPKSGGQAQSSGPTQTLTPTQITVPTQASQPAQISQDPTKTNLPEQSTDTDEQRITKEFARLGISNLSPLELDALVAAYRNLTGPATQRGLIVGDFMASPFGKLELSGPKAALDPNAFQIMRVTDKTLPNPNWIRFGLNRSKDGKSIDYFATTKMFKDVDLGRDVPEVAAYLNKQWRRGKPTIALLGAARMSAEQGVSLMAPIATLVKELPDAAYMTGGFRGQKDNKYGVTRAGYDVPKNLKKDTLVVMCEAGLTDAHQTPKAMDIYGKNWGDDTPGLANASDAAIFIQNFPQKVPGGKKFGPWTDFEVATFIHLKKPIVILDGDATSDRATYFGVQVPVFNDPREAARYLASKLPSAADLKARPLIKITGTSFRQRFPQHSSTFEDWMLVRLDFPNAKPRWVRQRDDDLQIFRNEGLAFPSDASVISPDGRNLILDGYWKDILLLQSIGKLPADATVDELAHAYSLYRKEYEAPGNSANMVKIAGIGFMFGDEHNYLDRLKALPESDYAKALRKFYKK